MNCPLCGTRVTAKDVTCPRCGTEVVNLFLAPSVESTVTPSLFKPPPAPVKKKKTTRYIIGIIAVALVLACAGSSTAYVIYRYNMSRDPYPPHNHVLLLDESLSNVDNGSDWPVDSSSYGVCTFTNGAYHVLEKQPGYLRWCLSNYSDFYDFTYEVQMTIVTGTCGGIIFRANAQAGGYHGYYYYEICKPDNYALYSFQLPGQLSASNSTKLPSSSQLYLLTGGIIPGLHTDANSSILITVVAITDTFALYLNHQKVDTVTDDTLSFGEIGVAAHETNPVDASHAATDVAFSNVKVWIVPKH
jgi:hypothetical protein